MTASSEGGVTVDAGLSTAPDEKASRRLYWRMRAQALVPYFGVWVALALLVIVAGALEPTLLSGSNLSLLLRQGSIIGLLAVGQTIVMLTGGIDLSVGSVVAVVNWVSTSLLVGSDRLDAPVIALCLGIGAAVGLLNGMGVTILRVPPFVMTLGMLFAVQAAGFIYTGGITKGEASGFLKHVGQGFAGPIPIAFLLLIGVALAAQFLLSGTTFGRQIYAVGANPRAARLTGLHVRRTVVLAYVMCGVTAAAGGLVLSGYIEIGDNTSGQGAELDAIAAVVIGGTTLAGGRGSVVGTIGGVLLLALLYNLLVILNIAQSGRLMLQGAVIVVAAAVYARSLRR
jgi:ribose/xylose/arabinose/galactoside ABC-type transport system permease subunit